MVQKILKTPLRNIKMAPKGAFTYDVRFLGRKVTSDVICECSPRTQLSRDLLCSPNLKIVLVSVYNSQHMHKLNLNKEIKST